MKIVIITLVSLSSKKEATAKIVIMKAKELMKKGHKVSVICRYRKEANLKKHEIIDGVNVYRFKKKIKPDLVYCYSSAPIFILKVKLMYPKAKLIFYLTSISRVWYGRMFYDLLSLADEIVVPTNTLKEILWFDSRIERFKDEKLKYSKEKIVLYYGGIAKEKGVQNLIEAMKGVKAKLMIILRHETFDKLKIDFKRTVVILGNADIKRYIDLADLIVLPYINMIGTTGNPLCLLEAMRYKKKVITSDLPELREIANKNVIFAEPNNVEDLREKIRVSLKCK